MYLKDFENNQKIEQTKQQNLQKLQQAGRHKAGLK